ncbi:MAG: pyruvate kinase [Alphaproteobacteria bacterium]
MKRNRQTKILATIGPASNSEDMIERLFLAGVDAFRMNFSHGIHEDHKKVYERIRAVEKKHNHPIGIIADMQGPKLRIGRFENDSIPLTTGQTFRFDSDETPGDETRVYLPHPEVLKAMETGSHIYLDDGKVRVEITGKGEGYLDGVVQSGSALSNNKGFNIPGVILPIPALTEKDRIDLEVALELGVDWIAQSFVQKPEDVVEARKLIDGRASLMVKIEKPSALEYLDAIVDQADSVMLARGDLGVEIPPEKVPAVQKHLVKTVRSKGKPVVVATQMLESMIENARPTRAEASDVATAVYDGADCVMLSAETAAGKYPERSVMMMDRITKCTEEDSAYKDMMDMTRPDAERERYNAITTAAYHVAKDTGAKLIVNYTTGGTTTLSTARQRPKMPILCLTPNLGVARRLAISYGVHAVHDEQEVDFSAPNHAADIAEEKKYVESGDCFVMTAGVPFGVAGSTNILRVVEVE